MRRWPLGPLIISLSTLLLVISDGWYFSAAFTQGTLWTLPPSTIFGILVTEILLLCAAVCLFRLMRASLYLYAVAFGADAILLIHTLPFDELLSASTLFDWLVQIVTLAYLYSLVNKGVLT